MLMDKRMPISPFSHITHNRKLAHTSVFSGSSDLKFGMETCYIVLQDMPKFWGIDYNLRNYSLITSYKNHQ